MAVREIVRKYSWAASTVAVLAILVAGYVVYGQVKGGVPGLQTEQYYTDDDGRTTFTGDINLLAPFDHNGKQAVKAHVFKCGDKTIVAFLSRYSAGAKSILETHRAALAKNPNEPPPTLGAAMGAARDLEFKFPGKSEWTKTAPGTPGRPYRCSDGSTGVPVNP